MKKNIIIIWSGIILIITAGLLIFVKSQFHSAVSEVKKETAKKLLPVVASVCLTESNKPGYEKLTQIKKL